MNGNASFARPAGAAASVAALALVAGFMPGNVSATELGNPAAAATIGDASGVKIDIRSFSSAEAAHTYTLRQKRAQTLKNAKNTATAATAASAAVAATFGDRAVSLIPDYLFVQASAVATAPIRVPVANDADTLDIACDGSTAVVVGANSTTPVSLVDLAGQREVATVAYPGKLARSVSVDGNGTQALVVLDATTVSAGGAIRRVTLSGGSIADSGKELAFGGDYVARVYLAPGGKAGVAIVGGGATRLVAFTVPALTVTNAVNLGAVGNAVVFSPDGTRLFVRSGQRGVRDAITAFGFDPVAGTIGATSLWRSEAVSGFTGTVFETSLAIAPDGSALVAGDENLGGSLLAPRLAVLDPSSGTVVRSVDLAADASPRIVATHRACAAAAPSQAAVEYYHAAFDHYFITTLANEIALLDNGTLVGWARTGRQFNVFAAGAAGAADTCRFFSESFAPKSSHFYTPYAAECTTVKANPAWQFEGVVFGLALPAADGACGAGTAPLYRLYNNGQGASPNHRYTTQLDVRAQMVGQGWIPEGAGIGVIGCVPL